MIGCAASSETRLIRIKKLKPESTALIFKSYIHVPVDGLLTSNGVRKPLFCSAQNSRWRYSFASALIFITSVPRFLRSAVVSIVFNSLFTNQVNRILLFAGTTIYRKFKSSGSSFSPSLSLSLSSSSMSMLFSFRLYRLVYFPRCCCHGSTRTSCLSGVTSYAFDVPCTLAPWMSLIFFPNILLTDGMARIIFVHNFFPLPPGTAA